MSLHLLTILLQAKSTILLFFSLPEALQLLKTCFSKIFLPLLIRLILNIFPGIDNLNARPSKANFSLTSVLKDQSLYFLHVLSFHVF